MQTTLPPRESTDSLIVDGIKWKSIHKPQYKQPRAYTLGPTTIQELEDGTWQAFTFTKMENRPIFETAEDAARGMMPDVHEWVNNRVNTAVANLTHAQDFANSVGAGNKRHIIQRKGRFVITRPDSDRTDTHHETEAYAREVAREKLREVGGGMLCIHDNLGHLTDVEIIAVQ